jgi:hypothetical protein
MISFHLTILILVAVSLLFVLLCTSTFRSTRTTADTSLLWFVCCSPSHFMSSHHPSSSTPSSMRDIEYQKITSLGEPTASPFLNEITSNPAHENGHSSTKHSHSPHSSLNIDTDSLGGELVADISLKQKYIYWKNYFQSMPLFGACVNFVNSIVGAGDDLSSHLPLTSI